MTNVPLSPTKVVLTLAEVQTILRIKQTTLYRRIAHGEIEARKLGGRTVIYRTELQRYIDQAPPRSTSAPRREPRK